LLLATFKYKMNIEQAASGDGAAMQPLKQARASLPSL